MSAVQANQTTSGPNPVAGADQTRGLWIGAACLLLAVPVTAWGYWNEPDRLAFWLFVPPLVAGLAAVVPLWLVWRRDPRVKGRGLVAYAVLFPILGIPVYLLYFLPVLGAWMLTSMGLGLGNDLHRWYLGSWWIGLTAGSGVLLASRPLGTRFLEWALPGLGRENGNPLASYFSLMMPWLVPLARLLQSRWWRDHRGAVLRVGGVGTALALVLVVYLALSGKFLEPPEASGSLASTVGYDAALLFLILVAVFVVLLLFGFLARVTLLGPDGSPDRIEIRPALIGLAVLALSAFFTGSSEDFLWEIALTPAIWVVCLIALVPVVMGLRQVLASANRIPRALMLLALLGYPVAYFPFHREAEEAHSILETRDQALHLIEEGRADDAIPLLEDALERALRQDMAMEAVPMAEHLVRLLNERQEYAKAMSVANRTLQTVDLDQTFRWGVEREPAYIRNQQNLKHFLAYRAAVLDLMTGEMNALLGLGRWDQAMTVLSGARERAHAIEDWIRYAGFQRIASKVYARTGQSSDAYHVLAIARGTLAHAKGAEEAKRWIQEAFEDLRRTLGEEAFQAAAAECARKDPKQCGDGAR